MKTEVMVNRHFIRAAATAILMLPFLNCQKTDAQMKRAREYGIEIGILRTGSNNAITDVPGVKVGQVTLKEGDSVKTGVTVILPHDGNLFSRRYRLESSWATGSENLQVIHRLKSWATSRHRWC